MSPETSVWIALASVVATFTGTWLTYRIARKQNAHEAQKVDQSAFELANDFNIGLVERLRGELKAVNEQLDRVYNQLARERDVSNQLREELWKLQARLMKLEQTVGNGDQLPEGLAT